MAKSKVIGDKMTLYKRLQRFISKHVLSNITKNTTKSNIGITTIRGGVISPLKRWNQLQAINSMQNGKE